MIRIGINVVIIGTSRFPQKHVY